MDYLLVVQAPCARVSAGVFATESAFAEHLRILRKKLGARFDRIVVAAPEMTDAEYGALAGSLGRVDADADGIVFLPLHRTDVRARDFWLHEAAPIWRKLRRAARDAEVVHSGISDDVFRPVMAMANAAGAVEGRDVIFIVDIDFRRDTWRYFKTGIWSLRSFLLNRVVYDPVKIAQVALAPAYCSLELLKSEKMARDFGRGAPHVKSFFNAAHSEHHIVPKDALASKLARLESASAPLELVYFGRMVPYKGIDRAIRAVVEARRRSGRAIALNLLGGGEARPSLEALVAELGAADAVRFHPPVPFGPELFAQVRRFDVSIATPLVEDTPRAAFDALASGLPVLAFDIEYYRDLATASGAVVLSPWEDVGALAEAIVSLDRDRARLAAAARRGVAFARENTADIWLERRVAWTLEMLGKTRTRPAVASKPEAESA